MALLLETKMLRRRQRVFRIFGQGGLNHSLTKEILCSQSSMEDLLIVRCRGIPNTRFICINLSLLSTELEPAFELRPKAFVKLSIQFIVLQ